MIATSDFVIDSWDEEPYDEQDGSKLTRTRITKTFSGEVEGTSTAEALMAYAQDGSVAYVGFERIVGAVGGLKGSFVLHHSATMSKAGQSTSWSVVPDSGSGELVGLVGRAEIAKSPDGQHIFTLDYEVVPSGP
ncbi:MAG: DUF3224 domain-containing protein [Actinomycetota bacterium]